MADDTQISKGTEDGDVIATDDIGGVKHQQVKMEFGGDGTATPVTDADPLPITNISDNQLLGQILGELQTMNYHLNLVTGGSE